MEEGRKAGRQEGRKSRRKEGRKEISVTVVPEGIEDPRLEGRGKQIGGKKC